MKNSVGLGINSAPTSDNATGTSTAAASPRHCRASTKTSPTGTSIGLQAMASPTTSPAATQERRCASSSATGRAAAEIAVQFPISTRFTYGLYARASSPKPPTAKREHSGTENSRSAAHQPIPTSPVIPAGSSQRSTTRGSIASGTAMITALGRYRNRLSSYGETPASSASAALTTKALSEPQFERRLVETATPRRISSETTRHDRGAGSSSQATRRSAVDGRSHFMSQMLGRSPTAPPPRPAQGLDRP